MQQSQLRKARQGLLARFAAGEIDKATYNRMLAELDQPVDDGEDAANRSFGDRPTMAPQSGAGRELSGFRLEAQIGRGGMGEVWKAYDPTAERLVVIKFVPPDVQNAAEEMARVKETFGRVHRLHHQHICPLYLLGEDPQYGYFVVMQYLDGQTLSAYRRSYVARCGSFPLEQVIRVLRPVAEALDYAHAQKVVHRDVKPQNILVCGDADDVQLVDFGLAAEVHTSLSRVSNVRMDTSGTRPYMAPEQWRGEYQDARTDQYALGVLAFELLAGRLPFDTPDFDILRACVLNDPPPGVPDQPEHVDRALARAMAKRREERFSSCRELIEALRGVSASPSVAQASPLVQASEDARPMSSPERELVNSIGMKLVLVPAGEYMMGSPDSEGDAHSDEKPQHRVRITKPFYLGAYPVTQEQYEQVMGTNPSNFKGATRPVECVRWSDAVEFCRELSAREGRTYRLPTEAEWEYACRAGSAERYCYGDAASRLGEYAWFDGNSGSTMHPVGQKRPNAWGLYDMHGNVWEWCQDSYAGDYYANSDDPQGPSSGSIRVFRGGSWSCDAGSCRSAGRNRHAPGRVFISLGFRLALVPAD